MFALLFYCFSTQTLKKLCKQPAFVVGTTFFKAFEKRFTSPARKIDGETRKKGKTAFQQHNTHSYTHTYVPEGAVFTLFLPFLLENPTASIDGEEKLLWKVVKKTWWLVNTRPTYRFGATNTNEEAGCAQNKCQIKRKCECCGKGINENVLLESKTISWMQGWMQVQVENKESIWTLLKFIKNNQIKNS